MSAMIILNVRHAVEELAESALHQKSLHRTCLDVSTGSEYVCACECKKYMPTGRKSTHCYVELSEKEIQYLNLQEE